MRKSYALNDGHDHVKQECDAIIRKIDWVIRVLKKGFEHIEGIWAYQHPNLNHLISSITNMFSFIHNQRFKATLLQF